MYPNAERALRRCKLPTVVIAEALGVTILELVKKLTGAIPFTLSEAKEFKRVVESDLPLEILFEEVE